MLLFTVELTVPMLTLGPWLICLWAWYFLSCCGSRETNTYPCSYPRPLFASLLLAALFSSDGSVLTIDLSLWSVQYVFERWDVWSDTICLARWHLQYNNLSLGGRVCCSKISGLIKAPAQPVQITSLMLFDNSNTVVWHIPLLSCSKKNPGSNPGRCLI